MKRIKKAIAVLLAVVMTAGAAGCSADKSWAMKTDTLTAPIGAYIYYLYAAYQTAESSVPDTSKPVLEQQIEGQSAEAWIKDKALTYTKEFFVVNDKMKELNLTLTADESKSASDSTDTQWEQYSPTLENFGVSKSSFNLAGADYYAKYAKIFDAVYGKGGSKEVSDADLKSFFEKNYTDFNYMVAPLYKTDATGSYVALTDAEKAAIKTEFEGYAADVTAGKKTMQQAADAYKTSSKQTTEQLNSATIVLDTDTSFPDDLKTAVKAMKNGEVKAVDLTSAGAYVLIIKNDITKQTAAKFSTADGRKAVLTEMKAKEYSDELEKEAKAYTKATINQKAIDSYSPSMFVTPVSSAAPTASAPAAPSAPASSK
jgi:hypothetical protein